MKSQSLPPGAFFKNLLCEEAGISSTEFAIAGALLVFIYLLLLLAVRLSSWA